MKKTSIIVFLLLSILVLSLSSLNVQAQEKPIIVSSTPFQTHQGETFTTTIFIPENANIIDFDITVKFDPDLLTLVNVAENDDIKGSIVYNTSVNAIINLNYTRTGKNTTEYTPLLDLTFSVDENIGVGVYDCLAVDKNSEYTAHRLVNNSLTEIDFDCNFARLNIYEMGDVDLSNKVDIGDATYIRRHLAKITGAQLDEYNLTLADTYCDGVIDIADAVCLQRRLAKLDVIYGNRINITFYDADGEKYITKSVIYGGSLTKLPAVPVKQGYGNGMWSAKPEKYEKPVLNDLEKDFALYAYYDSTNVDSEAMAYYKKYLRDMYYSGNLPTGLSSDLNLISSINYQSGYKAHLVWSSDLNYVLNSTTGKFTKPTYPQDLNLTVKIVSYDSNDRIESEDNLVLPYKVPGVYATPTKEEIKDFLEFYFTDSTDDVYRVNYDVKLVSKINNTVLPVEGSMYDNFEIRLDWFQNVNGTLVPINQIKRSTATQHNDYIAIATFNGKPVDENGGDGKIYIDNVEITAIDQLEIKNYIIKQIAAYQGTLATNDTKLWNNDTVYGTNVTWETGNAKIAYIANNTIELKNDAISGSTLPVNARVSYLAEGQPVEFVLSYNLTVSCNNTIIKAPENMDPELYEAIKAELEETLGYRGDLTSAALSSVQFVNLDLSDYPDITSLRGLSYCTNLRTLNISGIHITDGTMNQIASLSYLEAFIARGCGLDNLTDGGTPTLRNAVNLKMLDLTDNNFTTLDSVFASDKKYGNLREVYLSSNKLTNINALSRAPMMTYLSLSDNGLTTEGISAVANYPYLLYLSLADNKIDDISALKNLKYLKELRLQYNNLSNINDLRRLVNLEILYLGHNNIKDIGFLNSLTKLQILYANDNQIQDISALTSLDDLEAFNISNNKLASLAVLGKYKDTLKEIYAENNNLTDFSFINGASQLHILMLAGNSTTMIQGNMNTWLSGLPELEVLTLSDIRLSSLSFLSNMEKLVRLDAANCGLSAMSGEESNLDMISERYATLKILDISNNDFSDKPDEILKLRNDTLLAVLYADNIRIELNAYTLTYSMPELMYISLENCGITSMNWLSKYNGLVYVDLAGNAISEIDIDAYISNASIKTIRELYLDTTAANCSFADAYRVTDLNVEKLSLENVNIGKIEKLPYLDNIEYLNLTNTRLKNFTGDDLELMDMYSIERYSTLKTIDVSGLETDITPLENIGSLKTVYAVALPNEILFYRTDILSLYRMYNKGVDVYLYDKNTPLVPTSTVEGEKILGEIDDISCDITVAANNKISDNNPFIVDSINDFEITWTLSNPENYEIVDNHISVKSYNGIEDEELIVTAEITVYPDQAPVTRTFTVNTHILRASSNHYYDINATGYSEQLTRGSSFNYAVTLKANTTEGFAESVLPVEDDIVYRYAAKASNGTTIPYGNVISVNSAGSFTIIQSAPLNATATITVTIVHNNKSGEAVCDSETITIPIKVVSRTFTATFIMNGGTIVDGNGVDRSTITLAEETPIFAGLTYKRNGYLFGGWYKDASFNTLFSENGTGATMPSSDITLYAKWIAHSFKLYFNANGGSVSETERLVLCDTAFGTLPTPTRTGYDFLGWFTAASGGTQVTASTSMATADDITVYAHWRVKAYSSNWNAGSYDAGYYITVRRTSSPYAGAPTGEMVSGTTVYYGDVLSVTYTKADYRHITSNGKTSITVTGNVTSSDVYASAAWNDVSGWVQASNVPSGAQIVDRYYSYNLTSYTTSSSSSLSGWTHYDTQRTGWGAWSDWLTWNPSNGARNVEYRSQYIKTQYHYYRYTNSTHSAIYTQSTSNYGCTILEETWFDYILPVSQRGNNIGYVGTDNVWANLWVRVDYAGNYSGVSGWSRDIYEDQWRYQDPVYTYYFYKVESKESSSYPSGSNISNIVEWVKYRPK